MATPTIEELEAENDRLRLLILDACGVFEHYDLPEHAFHYRRELDKGLPTAEDVRGILSEPDPLPPVDPKTVKPWHPRG